PRRERAQRPPGRSRPDRTDRRGDHPYGARSRGAPSHGAAAAPGHSGIPSRPRVRAHRAGRARHAGARVTASAAWAMRRLRAMPATEIVHRARIRVRDKVAPPPYMAWPPERAFASLFACAPDQALRSSRVGQLARPADELDPAAFASTLGA